MEPRTLNPQKILYISGKWNFSVHSEKIFSYFRKLKHRENFSSFLKRKLFLYLRKWKPRKKKNYISVNETFLCGKSSNKCRNSFKLLPPINASPKIRKSLWTPPSFKRPLLINMPSPSPPQEGFLLEKR